MSNDTQASAPGPAPILWAILGPLMALALLLPGIRGTIPIGDAAEYVQYPYRTLAGDLPYRDFFMFYPPGHLIVPSGVYALFGPSILNLRLATVILTALVALVAALAWMPRPAIGAAALTVLIALLGGLSPETLLAWLSIGVAVALLRRWLSAPALAIAFAIGLASGLPATIRVEHLVALGAAVPLVMLLWYPAPAPGRSRLAAPSVLAFLAGLVLPLLACVIWALAAGVWAPMWRDLTTVSARHLGQVDLPLFPELQGPPSLTWVVLRLPGFLSPFVLPPVCLGVYLWALRRGPRPSALFMGQALFWLVFGTLHCLRGFTRADMVHILGASLPLAIAAAFPIAYLRRPHAPRLARAAGCALALFIIVPFGFDALMTHMPSWQQAAAPRQATLDSPAAAGILVPADQAAALNDLLAFIRGHTGPEEPIFVTPFDAPALYLLLGRHNPTRYDSLLPGFVDGDDEERLVGDLERAGVRCVVHRPGWGIDGRPDRQFEHFAPVLSRYLEQHFAPGFQSAGLIVFLRRP